MSDVNCLIYTSSSEHHIHEYIYIHRIISLHVTGLTKLILFPENTPIHIAGIYLSFHVCYSNPVSFIELLRIYSIHGEVCVKMHLDSKITQNFYGNKTAWFCQTRSHIM